MRSGKTCIIFPFTNFLLILRSFHYGQLNNSTLVVRRLLRGVCPSIAFANGFDAGFTPLLQTSNYDTKIVSKIIVMPDGKIVAAGNFNSYDGHPTGELVRLNADATLDQTFNNDLIIPGIAPVDVIVQPDGKFLVMGTFTLSDGTVVNNTLTRVDQNGFPDPTFSYSLGVRPWKVYVDSLGIIYALAHFN